MRNPDANLRPLPRSHAGTGKHTTNAAKSACKSAFTCLDLMVEGLFAVL